MRSVSRSNFAVIGILAVLVLAFFVGIANAETESVQVSDPPGYWVSVYSYDGILATNVRRLSMKIYAPAGYGWLTDVRVFGCTDDAPGEFTQVYYSPNQVQFHTTYVYNLTNIPSEDMYLCRIDGFDSNRGSFVVTDRGWHGVYFRLDERWSYSTEYVHNNPTATPTPTVFTWPDDNQWQWWSPSATATAQAASAMNVAVPKFDVCQVGECVYLPQVGVQ